MVELLINGIDAYEAFGVKMGDGFLDALNPPSSPKDYIENESRIEHGKRVLLKNAQGDSIVRLASREVSLIFVVEGDTPEKMAQNRVKFYNELYKGEMTIQVPEDTSNVYRLIYKGKPSSYGQDLTRTICKVAVKFEEPNPNNRDSQSY